MNLFIFILSFFSGLAAHDIHISNCDVIDNRKDQKLELSVKIFYDDLLKAVGLEQGGELPKQYSGSDDLINKFLNDHLVITINGEAREFTYVESISYPPAIWTSLIIEQEESIQHLEIKNTILLSTYDDQVNIVTIEIGDNKKKFYSLNHDEKNALWK